MEGTSLIQLHLQDLPSNLRVTMNLDTYKMLRRKLTENGYYRGSGQPWTNQARLYHALGIDWSDRNRKGYNENGRLWSLSLADVKEISKKAKVPLADLESQVINVFGATHARGIVGSFPIKIDENYAWLAGLWFGCGTYYAREKEVVFRVEYEVAAEIKRRSGLIGCRYYESRYIEHQARFPRRIIILPRTMYAIFKKLGLPNEIKGHPQHVKLGRNSAAREVHLKVPAFVKEDPVLARAFVEGYLNSTKLATWRYNKRMTMFGRMVNARIRGVDIRFVGPTKRQIYDFSNFVIRVLRHAGFTGSWHQITKRTGDNYEFGLIINHKAKIKALFRDFRIVKGSAQRVLEGI